MGITLTPADKSTIRTAAYGTVQLITFAGVAGSPHRAATDGTLALYSATGAVGHVLAEKKRDYKLHDKSAAALADQVLPALTASVALLEKADAAEAENFRATVTVAAQAAAGTHRAEPTAPVAAMLRKINEALAAA